MINMNGCLGSILAFILFLVVIVLLYRSGVFTVIQPVFSLLLDLISAVLRALTGIVINGYTPNDYNQLFNYR